MTIIKKFKKEIEPFKVLYKETTIIGKTIIPIFIIIVLPIILFIILFNILLYK